MHLYIADRSWLCRIVGPKGLYLLRTYWWWLVSLSRLKGCPRSAVNRYTSDVGGAWLTWAQVRYPRGQSASKNISQYDENAAKELTVSSHTVQSSSVSRHHFCGLNFADWLSSMKHSLKYLPCYFLLSWSRLIAALGKRTTANPARCSSRHCLAPSPCQFFLNCYTWIEEIEWPADT